ncbi:MAG: ATP-dependent Clp protease ATP-binding subunit [bacterium]|nr:ATP-dependent Clp protease ATP-binding subunit [bacterium]
MFDLKKTKIYRAVLLERLPIIRQLAFLKRLFSVLSVLLLFVFIYGFIPENFSQETNKRLLGLLIIFFVLTIAAFIKESFFESKIKKPKLKQSIKEVLLFPDNKNLAEFLSFDSARALAKALKRNSSTHLFYYLLRDNPKLDFIFSRLLLNVNEIKKRLKKELRSASSTGFQDIIVSSLTMAKNRDHERIEIGDVLSVLAKNDPVFKEILTENGLKEDDIDNLTLWLDKIEKKNDQMKRFWSEGNLAEKGTLARQWTAGYTLTLDKYSRDLTGVIRKRDIELVGHEQEIRAMERILSRGEINNVLVVGDSGTGKRSMVQSLARKSLLGSGAVGVNYKRFMELDLSGLLAQFNNSDEIEAVLGQLLKEVVLAGNIILVIDDIHNYIGQAPRPGIVDISGVIAPYLRMPQFQIIGITNYEGLHRYIEKNGSILSLFGKVEVVGISQQETLTLLEYLTFNLEKKYKIFISYPALREIISLTEKYLPSLHFPEKAIDILNETAVYVANLTKERIVLPKHVAKIITEKTEIPVGEMETKEKEILLNLEGLIHQRIINQEEAVKEISTALRRARSEITVRKGPMGTFLFLGPTGVGKTETSKALAYFYFGSEEKMIRLDMSEFQDIKDIPRLIGSKNEIGLLTTPVRENPFSLVLLDEIEKADSNVLNLFLQVLDEGHLTDGFGRKISFKNTIIIATSNAGYQIILEALKSKEPWSGVKQKLLDCLFEEGIFRPEFINRFDGVVLFSPLSKENLLNISQLMLSNLKENLKEKGIEFIITQELKEKIVELGYNPVFGARQMRRVIQDKVENSLASALLAGKIGKGSRVSIDPENFKLIMN